VIEMNWKTILKNVKVDAKKLCCTNLVSDFAMLDHKLADYYESMSDEFPYLKPNAEYMRQNAENILEYDVEETCDYIIQLLKERIESAKNPPRGESKLPSWYVPSAKKILEDFEKCKNEGKQDDARSVSDLFSDENPASFLDEYIRPKNRRN